MIKTNTLTDALLDYYTARAQGIPAERLEIRRVPRTDLLICVDLAHPVGFTSSRVERLDYSDDWRLAGPLIDTYGLTLEQYPPAWWANEPDSTAVMGDTPQVAICRAVVRAAFGDEVEEVAVCE